MGILMVILLAVSIAAIFYINFGNAGPPPTPPPDDVDTDDDGVPDATISFSMYQCMHLTYTDGTDHWIYPESRTTLSPLTIMDRTDVNKVVSTIQTVIYFTLDSSKTVSSVDFSATAHLRTCDLEKNTIMLFESQSISKTVDNPLNAVDVYVISSTLTAQQFEAVVGSSAFPIRYYVTALSQIYADVTFADGNTKTFGLTGIQVTTNQLWWRFQMYEPLQIVNLGAVWEWS